MWADIVLRLLWLWSLYKEIILTALVSINGGETQMNQSESVESGVGSSHSDEWTLSSFFPFPAGFCY